MRLTTFTDYSLRVLIYLAAKPGRQATIAEVAGAFSISANTLVKVAHFLGKEGLLENARGRRGGMRLALAPEAINLARVVHLTEGTDVPAECFDPGHNECVITRSCRLRGAFAEAVDAFYAVLGKYTLEDVARNRSGLAKVLFRASAIH